MGAFDVPFPLRDVAPRAPEGRSVVEPSRAVPVIAECDVAVFGGGPAGVCAAAAAARAGRRVVLVERYGFLGGTATAANVNWWHTLYGTDRRTRVIGGLAEEAIRRLLERRAAYNHAPDGETGDWTISSEAAKFVFDDLAVGSGADLLLHAWLAGVLRNGPRVEAALVETKGGRGAILAAVFVDCTGDADLVRRAGLETAVGDGEGGFQPPSLCFRVGGKRPGALPHPEVQRRLFEGRMDYNGEPYPTFLWGSRGVFDAGEEMMAGVRVLGVNGTDPRSLTRAEVEGRYQLRWLLAELTALPGWENVHLVDVAAQIGVRETHRILAEHQLAREEVLTGARFPDAVAQGTYPIDLHNGAGPGIRFEYLDGTAKRIGGDSRVERWRWDGEAPDAPLRETLCYQVPYRCLVPRGLENVLVAGRCIGAHHDSAGAIRVMVNAMQLGQAAGTAAALVRPGGDVREVEAPALRTRLLEAGMPLLG